MNYKETMVYLENTMKFGSRLGLERMIVLMEFLGHPGQNIPCIHIAGTNGKGSVTTMIANILSASGKRVGIYTSPFIHRFTERIRVVDGMKGLIQLHENEEYGEITGDETAECITQIRKAIDVMLKEGDDHPTEFEIVTVAAFIYFERMKCDFMVLETGLGGRLDSTNIVKNPLVCVITAIGYDHMDRLGNTISEIASEKAGILKKGADVVIMDPSDYTTVREAGVILGVLKKKAEAVESAKFKLVGNRDILGVKRSAGGQRFVIKNFTDLYDNKSDVKIETSLLGTFQPINCAVAIKACESLVTSNDVAKGIALSKWPGRMEVLRKHGPKFILDGGHNVQCGIALRKSLEVFFPKAKIVFICGVMMDKDYKGLIETVMSSTKYTIAKVICTTPNSKRALPAQELAKCTSEILDKLQACGYNDLVKVLFIDDVSDAVDEAMKSAKSLGAMVVAFGSFFMAGIIRNKVMGEIK